MQIVDGRLILAASDLVNFLECEHLTHLDLEVGSGRLTIEPTRTDAAELVAQKGDEHEAAHLASLRRQGREVVEIASPSGHEGLRAGARRTLEAMRAGAEVIYQGVLFDGERWRGHADFLERVPRPSALGNFGYEVADTKLARHVRPYFVIQLCLYSEMLSSVQGAPPAEVHVLLGSGERVSLRLADFAAYHRRLRRELEDLVSTGTNGTYPEPVEHCAVCRWSGHCDSVREADDHLSLVARMGRPQIARLREVGIDTVLGLAGAADEDRPGRVAEHTFERLRAQADLQVHQRTTGELRWELLRPEDERGFALLPPPSEGDVFFDIEGDPFYDDGLEYLFGVSYRDGGEPTFRPFWGRDRAEEKRAFENFVDFVMARIERFPDLHVYHYAAYEPTALRRLTGLHATREHEVDRLLRGRRLVDLYRVVEQGLRLSQPSYSIKKVEAFYLPVAREASVTDGEDSIVKFEQWLGSGDQELLDWIERYNAEDCNSTLLLREWLLARRAEAIDRFGEEIPFRSIGEPELTEAATEELGEVAALRAELWRGLSEEESEVPPQERSRWLLGHLLGYHRREDKPVWWELFERFERSEQELIELDTEAIGGLESLGDPVPIGGRSPSSRLRLSFPPQEHKLGSDTGLDPFTVERDPETGSPEPFSPDAWELLDLRDGEGWLEVRVGPSRRDHPPPRALIPGRPLPNADHRAALRELAGVVVEQGLGGDGPHRAARDLLARPLPRSAAVRTGGALQEGEHDLARTKAVARGLDESHLFVQGPPGSGKTYTGAHLILDLLAAGHRVGVAAPSHKAINNLLHEVELHAPANAGWRGLKKSSTPEQAFESKLPDALIDDTRSGSRFPTGPDTPLMAGVSWLWCRADMRTAVDYLVIDEAGQVSLADALAMATATRNVILLGDPLQLAHVSQATHPEGVGSSVLEHLLAGDGTVHTQRGVFLDRSRRMHPDVCRFVSAAVYDDRLGSIEECANQRIDSDGELSGAGMRSILVEHQGNTRQSREEALAIADRVGGLRGASFTRADGTRRLLRDSDLMVVTPYNAQVRCLRFHLPPDVQVGTVDKFQGQEAAIVFFSMATSSGEEIPRGVEFLYSRNRLNVAVSRARCLAVLVASPDLLTIRCRSIEQMRLVNALCRLVEVASEQT